MERKCMSRLANYLAIITLDESQLRHGSSAGIVKERFPKDEWSDAPFPQNMQMFCLPHGWTIVAEKRNPMFFVTTLTDLSGAHQFLFCLQTYEAMEVTSDDDDDNIKPNGENMLQVYKPVVIAFISSYPFVEFFRTVLSKILTYEENKCDVERLITDVIGNIVVNNSFRTIYLERQSISVWAPKEPTLQITTSRVYLLVKYLGSIHNLILLFRCLMSEQNIVFHSCSLNRLFNATYALQTLLYPLEYAHTLVSILPESLIDYLESPTPFLMGILTSSLPKIPSVECALIDLDQGEFKISPELTVPEIPEPYNGRLIERLKLVLYGDVQQEDNIVQDSQSTVGDDFDKDKKIRACFLLFFVEFLRGYRTCLEVVRLYEKPFIVFHQAAFLGLRQLFDPFSKYVTSCQMFQVFISNRGLPYRESDYFDKLMFKHPNDATGSCVDKSLLEEIVTISNYLEQNEKQCCVLPDTNWVAKPKVVDQLKTDDLLLHLKKVDQMIQDSARSRSATPESSAKIMIKERENCWNNTAFINHRRLVVLEKCVQAIFDKKVADASKMILAAEFSLKIPEARIFLCRSLEQFAIPVSKATLSADQFELVVRLLNFSLDQESTDDEYGVAYACVRLSFLFCKVISQGVFQFVYTCIQNHPVWKCPKFWETCFYHDVHLIIEKHYDCGTEAKNQIISEKNLWNLMNENSSLIMVAEHLKTVEESNEDDDHLKHIETEDEILFSQAKHYINLIVLLRTPIETETARSKVCNNNKSEEMNTSQNQLYPYIDSDQKNSTEELIKWISKLVYGMCSSANLKSPLIHRLLTEIRHLAYMQLENLQIIQEESKRNLSVTKKAVVKPISYLPNEKILMEGLSCLLIDHKANLKTSDVTQPAQGVIFLTNYCIYFKGNSCEYGEETEMCVPLMSIVKKISLSDDVFKEVMKQITHQDTRRFHSPIMIRTIHFQTVCIFFDEQVNPLSIESLWSNIVGVRWPTSFQNAFLAYSNDNGMLTLSNDSRRSSKMPSFLRDITLNKSKKDFRTGMESTFSLSTSPRRQTAISQIDDHKKTSCFLSTNHSYLTDYARMMKRSDIRLSHANKFYDISKTLPSCILVPTTVKDDFLFKIRKIYKYNRLPAITWANTSGQVLLRGSSFNSSNLMLKLKNQAFNRSDLTSNFSYSKLNFLNKHDFEVMSTDAANQEDYFNQIIQAVPTVIEAMYHPLQLNSFYNLVGTEMYNPVFDRIKTVAWKMEKSHKSAMEIVHGVLSKPDVLQTSAKNEKPIELVEGDKRKLFMLSDKTSVKVLGKNENVQVVQTKYPSISEQKTVFKQLCRTFNSPAKSKLHVSFYESGWLQKVAEIIRLSVSMSTIINSLKSSLSLCIEDGWDATCQLMSLTQILSDPFYRTIEGFGILIDKEWAAYGYHFSSRNNCSVISTNNDIIPVFLIFLDAVHQILVQFPTCFEFNDYFLRFIAYHSTTAYFRTFVLDCESDRVQLDYTYPDVEKNKNIWRYIKKLNDETAKFKNWSYSDNTEDVIIPSSSIASMEIWSFYVERLQTNGTAYEIRKRNWLEPALIIKESSLICSECSPLVKDDRINVNEEEICDNREEKRLSSPRFSVDPSPDDSVLYSEYIQEAYKLGSLFSLLMMRESSPPSGESTSQSQVDKKSEPVFVYQGYLTKKGARTNMKKERWFALDSVNRKLLCFDRPNDRLPKHVIELPDIKNVSTEAGTNKSSLVITTHGKTHVLSSNSIECINEWKRNIEKLLFE
ncbi:unnamed protein product [Auanema sp. JU1783]|nr:unnamed protein product [Auanema sp. JU1783]